MKNFILFTSMFCSTAISAQHKTFTPVLNSYLDVKNELVLGNSANASKAASSLNHLITSLDMKSLSASELKIVEPMKQQLLNDASTIAETNDLAKQRATFASLSNQMIVLAKAVSLSDKEVYVDYCPMKKASWLSLEKPIKNPYYGNAMLSCGSVKETIKQ